MPKISIFNRDTYAVNKSPIINFSSRPETFLLPIQDEERCKHIFKVSAFIGTCYKLNLIYKWNVKCWSSINVTAFLYYKLYEYDLENE